MTQTVCLLDHCSSEEGRPEIFEKGFMRVSRSLHPDESVRFGRPIHSFRPHWNSIRHRFNE
jgi:hypothetical protein